MDNVLYDVSESTIYSFQESGDFDGVSFDIIRNFGIQCPFSEEEFISAEPQVLIEKLYRSAREAYDRKSQIIQDRVFPVIQNVYENQSESFENIVIAASLISFMHIRAVGNCTELLTKACI